MFFFESGSTKNKLANATNSAKELDGSGHYDDEKSSYYIYIQHFCLMGSQLGLIECIRKRVNQISNPKTQYRDADE